MIVQFSLENFLSFKEQSTLSMVATPLREDAALTENVLVPISDSGISLLKSALILGPNASGKSNVIKAFDFFKRFLVSSFKDVQAGEEIGVDNFRLDVQTASEPTSFELIFICGDNQYRYGFDVTREKVLDEWLYRKACRKRAKEVELFLREEDTFKVHPSMPLLQDIVNRKMVRPNALLLSAGAQFNDTTAVEIIGWLTDTTVLSCSEEDLNWKDALRHFDDETMRKRIVAFSQYADLGIEDIEKSGDRVTSRHNQYDADGRVAQSVSFPFLDNESEGTIKYFSLAYPIIDALDHGKRLIVDEFDSKMHPLLTERVITLFNSKDTNPRGAQLIFTAHDSNLLSSGAFRRDQVWFTEKDRLGASKLFSLAEYKVRSGASFEKGYLAGKYGATPILGNMSNLFVKEEQ
jgi:hypothetical protein